MRHFMAIATVIVSTAGLLTLSGCYQGLSFMNTRSDKGAAPAVVNTNNATSEETGGPESDDKRPTPQLGADMLAAQVIATTPELNARCSLECGANLPDICANQTIDESRDNLSSQLFDVRFAPLEPERRSYGIGSSVINEIGQCADLRSTYCPHYTGTRTFKGTTWIESGDLRRLGLVVGSLLIFQPISCEKYVEELSRATSSLPNNVTATTEGNAFSSDPYEEPAYQKVFEPMVPPADATKADITGQVRADGLACQEVCGPTLPEACAADMTRPLTKLALTAAALGNKFYSVGDSVIDETGRCADLKSRKCTNYQGAPFTDEVWIAAADGKDMTIEASSSLFFQKETCAAAIKRRSLDNLAERLENFTPPLGSLQVTLMQDAENRIESDGQQQSPCTAACGDDLPPGCTPDLNTPITHIKLAGNRPLEANRPDMEYSIGDSFYDQYGNCANLKAKFCSFYSGLHFWDHAWLFSADAESMFLVEGASLYFQKGTCEAASPGIGRSESRQFNP